VAFVKSCHSKYNNNNTNDNNNNTNKTNIVSLPKDIFIVLSISYNVNFALLAFDCVCIANIYHAYVSLTSA